jgi:RHS repeat-associated protein
MNATTRTIASLALAALSLPAFAQSIEGAVAERIYSTSPCAEGHAAHCAIDKDGGSAWKPVEGTDSGLELEFADPIAVSGIELDAVIASGTTLFVEFRYEGRWIPFSSMPVVGARSGTISIDVSGDRVTADAIALRLSGNASDCEVREIRVSKTDSASFVRLLSPSEVVTSFESWRYPRSFLSDGDPWTEWRSKLFFFEYESASADARTRLGAPEAKVPSPLLEAASRDGVNGLNADGCFVEYLFDASVDLRKARVFVRAGGSGTLIVTAVGPDGDSEIGRIDLEGHQGGWIEFGVALGVRATKIVASIEGLSNGRAGIGEFEAWGAGTEAGDAYRLAWLVARADDGTSWYEADIGPDRNLMLELRTDGEDAPSVFVNGRALAMTAGPGGLYVAKVSLWMQEDGYQILSISGATVRFARFRIPASDGSLGFVGAGPYLDGSVVTGGVIEGEATFSFGRAVALREVLVHGDFAASSELFALSRDGVRTSLPLKASGDGWATFGLSIDNQATAVAITGIGNVYEIRAYGSETLDVGPRVRLFGLPEDEGGANAIGGFINDPRASVTLNGVPVDASWQYLSGNVSPDAEYAFTAIATTPDGRVDTFYLGNAALGKGTIRLDGETTLRTLESSVTITGRVTGNYELYVNGSRIALDTNKRFIASVEVPMGYSTIEFVAKKGSKFAAREVVRVVRYHAAFSVSIKAPVEKTVAADQVIVRAVAEGQVVQATIGGVPATIVGDSFFAAVPLNEGDNAIEAIARDRFGRIARASIVVVRDTQAPIVEFVSPAEGSLSGSRVVKAIVRVVDATPVRVYINGVVASAVDGHYETFVALSEGDAAIESYAVDAGGNVGPTATRMLVVDVTPPASFTPLVSPEGWTNDTTPTVSFFTTDAISGVSRYEGSIDGGPFTAVTSPWTLPELADGQHNVAIRAVDAAGNALERSVVASIDTVAPDGHAALRAVPDSGRMELRWTVVAEDAVSTRVTRFPEWQEGARTVAVDGEAGVLADEGTVDGSAYRYFVTVIDRAGNESATVEVGATSGVSVDPIAETGTSLVEFGPVTMLVPEGAVAEDVRSIIVSEVPSAALAEMQIEPGIGPVYRFAVASDESGETVREHDVFAEPIRVDICYDPAYIPEGLDEGMLGAFYFDEEWGIWKRVEGTAIDLEKNIVSFETRHFTIHKIDHDFDGPFQGDLIEGGFEANWTHLVSSRIELGGLSIGPQSGSIETVETDLVLRGTNGFEFPIRRFFDSNLALLDSAALTQSVAATVQMNASVNEDAALASIDSQLSNGLSVTFPMSMNDRIKAYVAKKVDRKFTPGLGWRFDFPEVVIDENGGFVRLPGGSTYPMAAMGKPLVEYRDNKKYTSLKNDYGEPFEVVFEFEFVYFLFFRLESATPESITVIRRDGTKYIFDSKGRIDCILDSTDTNKVDFTYGNDGVLNEVKVSSKNKIDGSQELINTCVFKSNDQFITSLRYGDRVVTYKQGQETIDGKYVYDSTKLLTSIEDSLNRITSYEYQGQLTYIGSVEKHRGNSVEEELGFDSDYPKRWAFLKTAEHLKFHGRAALLYSLVGIQAPAAPYVKATTERKVLTHTNESGFTQKATRIMVSKLSKFVDNTKTIPLESISISSDFNVDSIAKAYCKTSTSNDGRTIVTRTFDPKSISKTYYQKGRSFTEQETIPYETKIEVKTADKVLVSTTTRDCDSKLRLTSEFTQYPSGTEGPSRYWTKLTLQYSADMWNNVTKALTETYSNGRSQTIEVETQYVTPGLELPVEGAPDGYKPTKIKRSIYDLPLKRTIRYSEPYTGPDYITEPSVNRTRSSTQFFEYNTSGWITASYAVGEGKVLKTCYAYNGEDKNNSLQSIEEPYGNGQRRTTTFENVWDLLKNRLTVTTTTSVTLEKGAAQVDTTTETVLDTRTNDKLFARDPRGYVYAFEYDKLGRMTSASAPAGTDATGMSFDDESIAARKKASFAFNDTLNTITVTSPEGVTVVYNYDKAGRLVEHQKKGTPYTNGGPLAPATYTTKLGYDIYGQVTSVTDPRNNVTSYKYDSLGRVTTVDLPDIDEDEGLAESPGVSKIQLEYEENGFKVTSTDGRGNKRVSYRDVQGNVYQVDVYPDRNDPGKVETSKAWFDAFGRVVLSQDAGGIRYASLYDDFGRIEKSILPAAPSWVREGETLERRMVSPYVLYSYDDAGFMIASDYCADGEVWGARVSRNELGWPLSVEQRSDSAGAYVETGRVRYDLAGHAVNAKDANDLAIAGPGVEVHYDPRGLATKVTDRDGTIFITEFDTDGRPTKKVDPRGSAYDASILYDGFGRIWKVTGPAREAGGSPVDATFEYDSMGNVVAIRAIAQPQLTTSYNSWNLPYASSVGTGNEAFTSRKTYNYAGNVVSASVDGGLSTRYEYDGLNRPVKELRAGGGISIVDYNARGLVESATTLIDGTRSLTVKAFYDALGRLTETSSNAGTGDPLKAEYCYDPTGLLVRHEDAREKETLFDYDHLGRLTKETRANGASYSYAYDAGGRLTGMVDPNGISTSVGYDADSRIQFIGKTLGAPGDAGYRTQSTEFSYDPVGQVMSMWSQSGGVETSRIEFNKIDNGNYYSDPYGTIRKMERTIGGKTHSIGFGYDAGGRLDSIKYPGAEGLLVEYGYDARGLLSSIDGWVKAGTVTYDAAWRLTGYELATDNPIALEQTYAANGALETRTWTGGDVASFSQTYGYDLAGNMVSKNGDTFEYDLIGRMTKSKEQSAIVKRMMSAVEVAEDYDGQKKASFAIDDVELRLDYSGGSIAADLGSAREVVAIELAPNVESHRVDAEHLSVYGSTTNLAGDYFELPSKAEKLEDGRIHLLVSSSVDVRYVKVHCQWDDRDEHDAPVDASECKNRFDVLMRVAYRDGVVTTAYSYDPNGNRSGVSSAIDTAVPKTITTSLWPNTDRMQYYGGIAYRYDANGNLIEKGTHFDALSDGKPKVVNGDIDIYPQGEEYRRYHYDLWNRLERVEKASESAGPIVAASYGYDPMGLRALKSGADGSKTWYMYGPGGELLYEEKESGESKSFVYGFGALIGYEERTGDGERAKYFTITDNVGSVLAELAETGEVVSKTSMDPFGDHVTSYGRREGLTRFGGKDFDEDAGLYYFNARWYDASLGRFTTEDPAKDGGNWYAYCGSGPLTRTDPTGMMGGPVNEYEEAMAERDEAEAGGGGEGGGEAESSKEDAAPNRIYVDKNGRRYVVLQPDQGPMQAVRGAGVQTGKEDILAWNGLTEDQCGNLPVGTIIYIDPPSSPENEVPETKTTGDTGNSGAGTGSTDTGTGSTSGGSGTPASTNNEPISPPKRNPVEPRSDELLSDSAGCDLPRYILIVMVVLPGNSATATSAGSDGGHAYVILVDQETGVSTAVGYYGDTSKEGITAAMALLNFETDGVLKIESSVLLYTDEAAIFEISYDQYQAALYYIYSVARDPGKYALASKPGESRMNCATFVVNLLSSIGIEIAPIVDCWFLGVGGVTPRSLGEFLRTLPAFINMPSSKPEDHK